MSAQSSRASLPIVLAAALLLPTAADASPWTQPKGKLAVKLSAAYQWASGGLRIPRCPRSS